jgi:hypothetical protein
VTTDPGRENEVGLHVGTGPGTHPEYEGGADAPATCEYCGRPFRDAELLALHHGHAHGDRLTDDQRAAFEAAYEAESDAVRRYQLKAAGAVIALYFLFLMVYAVV